MDYEVDPLFEALKKAIVSDASVTDRMARVMDECARQRPHPDWKRMRRIDFQLDEPSLGDWLPRVLAAAPPTDSIKGVWFGLNNPARKGRTTADIYIGLSESFDADDLDWATDLVELSGRSDLRSKVLEAVCTEAYGRDGGLGNDAEYPLVLAYGSMCALRALESISPMRESVGLRGAACGFDSGDAFQLGQFKGNRFDRKVVEA